MAHIFHIACRPIYYSIWKYSLVRQSTQYTLCGEYTTVVSMSRANKQISKTQTNTKHNNNNKRNKTPHAIHPKGRTRKKEEEKRFEWQQQQQQPKIVCDTVNSRGALRRLFSVSHIYYLLLHFYYYLIIIIICN